MNQTKFANKIIKYPYRAINLKINKKYIKKKYPSPIL